MNDEKVQQPHLRIEKLGHRPGGLVPTFADGLQLEVDLAQAIGKSRVLAPILADNLLRKARVVDMGRTVRWPGGEDFEISSDQLRAWGVEQAGGFSHAGFIAWMWKHQHTLDSAAAALGLSRRMVAYYRDGSKAIPRTVELACKGWESLQSAKVVGRYSNRIRSTSEAATSSRRPSYS